MGTSAHTTYTQTHTHTQFSLRCACCCLLEVSPVWLVVHAIHLALFFIVTYTHTHTHTHTCTRGRRRPRPRYRGSWAVTSPRLLAEAIDEEQNCQLVNHVNKLCSFSAGEERPCNSRKSLEREFLPLWTHLFIWLRSHCAAFCTFRSFM